MSTRTRPSPNQGIAIVSIVALGFALRLYQLGDQSLWYDEAYSWFVIMANDLRTSMEIILADYVHPPLFYLLGRPFVLLGDSEWALRLFAVTAGTLALPVMYQLGKQVGDSRTGLLALLLLATNPFHIWFSRDARMYTLSMLLVLVSIVFFLQLLQGRRVWSWFTLFNGLAFLTHYFCLTIPLAQLGYFLLRFRQRHKLFRRWTLSMAFAFAPMVLWLGALRLQEQQLIGIGWIPKPAWWAPLTTLWNFSLLTTAQFEIPTMVVLSFFALAMILGLGPSRHRQWLVLWLGVPMIAALLISFSAGKNVYVDRFFIISLPAYLLFLALGVTRLPRRFMQIALAAALVAGSTVGTVRTLADPGFEKDNWRDAMKIIESQRRPDDLVVMVQPIDIIPATYYARQDLAPWTYLAPGSELEEGVSKDPWASVLAKSRSHRLWLIYQNPRGSNHLVAKGLLPFEVYRDADPYTQVWLDVHSEEVVDELPLAGLTVLFVELAQ